MGGLLMPPTATSRKHFQFGAHGRGVRGRSIYRVWPHTELTRLSSPRPVKPPQRTDRNRSLRLLRRKPVEGKVACPRSDPDLPRLLITVLLYDNPASGNCYKVRLILSLLGIEFERRELSVVDHSDRAEVLDGLSPSLNVPTVVFDDGRPLAESNAILWYFADGTRYLPDGPYERAQVLQWMFFEQYKHEPAIAVLRFWLSISEQPQPVGNIEAKRAAGHAALEVMERHFGDHEYFVAERFTIADIALYAYTHVAPEAGFDLESYSAVRAWLKRIAAQPGIIPITA